MEAEEIVQRLCTCGYEAYIVGGAVRDMLLGRDPNDEDIVTNASPDELSFIFKDQKVNNVGANFLVTIIDNIEVSTYRKDLNFGPDRKNCSTTQCETLNEDLKKRDFTINSIATCPYTGHIIDIFNGREDLKNKIIRFVGNPNQRIYEDYIRMIRAARFCSLIEGQLEENSFKAIKDNKDLVKEIAPERIRLELLKVMGYRKPSIFFNVLYETGILEILIPELYIMHGFTGGQYHSEHLHEHYMICGDSLSPKDKILRLTGYLHDIGKPDSYVQSDGLNFVDHEKIGAMMAESLLLKYKFSTKEITRIKDLILVHMRQFIGTPKSTRKLLKYFSDFNINWKDWIRLKIADKKANLSKNNYTREEIKSVVLGIRNCFKTPEKAFQVTDLQVNGKDIMEITGLSPGPKIGIILKSLLEIVLETPEDNNREKLISLAKGMNNGIYN